MAEQATMPPPARLGHEFQQQAPPPEIQQNIEKAMAQKEAVLDKAGKGFLDGLKALGDQNSDPSQNDGRGNTQKVEQKVEKPKAEKKPAKTAEDIQKASEEGVAKPLSADPMEALEQVSESEKPAEAKETAKEEAKVEEKSEPTDPKEREKYKWGELKAKADKYDKESQEWSTKEQDWQKQITEREERVKAFEEKAKRAEELEKKMEELRVKVAKADILDDPDYQDNFVKPYEETMGFLKQAADAYSLNWPSLVQIMETSQGDVERNKAFAAMIADSDTAVDTVTQSQMAAAMMDINKLRAFDKQLKENALQAWEAMNLEKESKTKAEQEKSTAQRREDAKAAFRRMQKSIPEMKDANEEEWVESLAMADHPTPLRAAQAYALKALPSIMQNHKAEKAALKAEVDRLNGIIKARSNGGPKLDPAGGGGGAASNDTDSRPFGERLRGA